MLPTCQVARPWPRHMLALRNRPMPCAIGPRAIRLPRLLRPVASVASGTTGSGGDEQLDPDHEAVFMRLVAGTADVDTKDMLRLNKAKLVKNEVITATALQALTPEKLMAYGLSEAAAGALKLAFPSPVTTGAAAGSATATGACGQDPWHMTEQQKQGAAAGAATTTGNITSVPVNQLPSPKVVQGLLEFAKAVLEADTNADIIKLPRLPNAVPRALRRSIMVRQCYRDVVQRIMEANDGAAADMLADSGFAYVLTGTPGIGKGALALYLICFLAQQRQKLVYRYYHHVDKDTLVLLDFTDPTDIKVDRATESAGGIDRLTGHIEEDPCTWLLVDGSAPPTQFGEAGRMIIMTSPNEGNYSQFIKASAVEELWLPVWSLEELEACRAELYPWVDADIMKDRYTHFGGVVRFVLAKPTFPFAKLMQKLSRAEADRLIHLDMEDARSDVRHSLAHAQVDEDYNFVHYALGSPMIIEEVAEKAEYSMRTLTKDLMLAESERPGSKAFAIMLGEMLERYVHKLLVAGWYLDPSNIRQLQPAPRQAPAITRTQFTAAQIAAALAAGWEHHWDDAQDLDQVEGYFQPRSSNQAGYDSFINTKGFTIIIQATRDPNHQVNTEGIMSLVARLPTGKPACILFVLPEHPVELAQHYGYQSWTMEMPAGQTKKGKDKFKRRVVTDSELPVDVNGVEQWVTPFPLFQGGTSSSTEHNVGSGSDTEG